MDRLRYGPTREEVTGTEVYVTRRLGRSTAIPLHALPPDGARIILKDLAPRQLSRFGKEGTTYYLMGPGAYEGLMRALYGADWQEAEANGEGPYVEHVDGGPVQPSIIKIRRPPKTRAAALRSPAVLVALLIALAVLLNALLPRYVPAGSRRALDRWTGELCPPGRWCQRW
jgi:hypothetical protein